MMNGPSLIDIQIINLLKNEFNEIEFLPES